MTNQSASAIADKWASAMGTASAAYTAGVQAVTESPAAKAAASVDRWIQAVTAARSKFVNALNNVQLSDWKAAAANKGASRLAQGATAAKPRFTQFMGKFLPFLQSTVNALPPRGDLEQNIARMNQMVRAEAQFSNT